MTRRDWLRLSALLALPACRHEASPKPFATSESSAANAPSDELLRELRFEPTPATPEGERALLMMPPDPSELPMLVALHGRGESGRGLDVGADAWPNNYQMTRVHQRLTAPPIVAEDLLKVTTPSRLAQINRSLEANPYKGLVVACPYTPFTPVPSSVEAEPFAGFVIDELLPAARTMAKTKDTSREKTAIDGVSMGGRMALLVGLSHPEIFGVVGGIQPAINVDELQLLVDLAKSAFAKQPVKLRLATSTGDYFLEPVKAYSAALKAANVPHELVIVAGDHGYDFNRGPGSAELLLGNERALRGLPPP